MAKCADAPAMVDHALHRLCRQIKSRTPLESRIGWRAKCDLKPARCLGRPAQAFPPTSPLPRLEVD